MASEFKIGRLRFTWKGEWNDATFYNRDAIVQYDGKCYVCKEPHTSQANFYSDLNFVTPSLAQQPRWELMLDGVAWKQNWTPNTFYSLGNIVRYGGIVYVCIDEHTSGTTQIDLTKWTTYSRFDNWNSVWATATVYGLGDIVKYGGIVYRCILNHISAATTTLGLEPDLGKWEIVNNGLEYKGPWTASTRYKLNDLVRIGPDVQICTLGHTSTSTFDDAKFNIWAPGQAYESGWDQTITYQAGDIVIYGGYSYISLINNNLNIIPSVNAVDSSSAWSLVTKGYDFKEDWAGGTYRVGDVVRRGGRLFVAIADNVGQDPSVITLATTYTATGSSGTTLKVNSTTGIVSGMIVTGIGFTRGQTVVSITNSTTLVINEAPDATLFDSQALTFVGINYTYWRLLVPGTSWKNFWQASTLYSVGELVIWQNATYRCIRSFTSLGSTIRPDLDTTNSYWTPYVLHDRFNAGNTQGDIVARNSTNSTNIAVPIGLQDQVLRSTDGEPMWKTIQVLPDIYYVAPDGEDDIARGTTIDDPWKTIKYACETIAAGTYFQNANTILTENKLWLVEEMYQWMLNQKSTSTAPFSPSSVFDEFSTRRDAKIIIDALSYDITRGSNSRIVFATEYYFADGSDTTFRTAGTDAAQEYIAASLSYLLELIGYALSNTAPPVNYQIANSVPVGQRIAQITGTTTAEAGAYTEVESLMNLLITAIADADKSNLPFPNAGITATIMVKTGTYSEELPIVIPDNVALNGDELRGTVVQPKTRINTFATISQASTDEFTVYSVADMAEGMPIQFSVTSVNDEFSSITLGQTYYIRTINQLTKKIKVSETIGGPVVPLNDGSGYLIIYAGDCLKDMFYVRNATGIRNMTLTGLAGSLTARNSFGTQRPTGGAYTSLDPGTGPNDTRAWILRRSPYIQNVTTFGVGCTGLKIDGRLHNGGNKSIVCNDFTQILSDGIGVWCTGPDSLTECVSVFSYYGYAGYFAEDGGRIRATNGNTSYGTYGVIAEGFDDTEVPITGLIDNRSTQVQADVQSAFGTAAEILAMQYNNAGSGYLESTTNLLTYSNTFNTGWTTDGNVSVQQNTAAPTGESIGWTFTGATSSTDTSYIYQDNTIPSVGATYTGLSALNVTGSGQDATFDITVGAQGYSALVNSGGTGYVVGNQLRILGSDLGGADGTNDCFLEVQSLAGSSLLTVTPTGVVPLGSAQTYTFSIHAKKSTSSSFDMMLIFSGSSTCSARLNFNFDTKTFTTAVIGATSTPALAITDKLELSNGWYRISLTANDYNATNTSLQARLYPRGLSGNSGSTRFYGAQLQIGSDATFYLDTQNNRHTSYADFYIKGSGTGVEVIGDEIRSGSNFQTRMTDTGTGIGGRGYLIGSNNAQGGDEDTIILSGADVGTELEYLGMRVFVQSGTGAGQYGYISAFDETVTKTAQVLKESFTPLNISSTSSATSRFTLASGNTDTLYIDQKIQFVPTFYSTNITQTGTDTIPVLNIFGGVINSINVISTAKLSPNMTVRFTGTAAGAVTTNFTYYIKEIIDGTSFSISTEPSGVAVPLVTAVPALNSLIMSFPSYTNYIDCSTTTSMLPNMPITFVGTTLGGLNVGTTYYVNDVIDSNTFTISTTLIELTATATQATTNYVTTSSTTNLVPLNPVLFSGTTIGGLSSGIKYYINKIINSSQFTVTTAIIETTATLTEAVSNLITVSNTTGFIVNNPIQFVGNTFGGIENGRIYFILAINDSTTFTVSTSPGGSALNLSTGFGEIRARTTNAPTTLTTASGSMSITSTNTKASLTFAQGSMVATYKTKIFGNVVAGTTYYVKTIPSTTTFTVSSSLGGSTFGLVTDNGGMRAGAVGWDHINPGTVSAIGLDNSSVYYIEPRVEYTSPSVSQISSTLPTLGGSSQWQAIAYGNSTYIAIPDSFGTAAKSTNNGTTWSTITLPLNTAWTDIAYGNNYWVVIANDTPIGTGSSYLYSNSTGAGWRAGQLPSKTDWTKIAYGNGKFVTISSTSSAYSVNFGKTWSTGSGLPTYRWTGLTYGAGKFVAISNGKTFLSLAGTNITATGSSATFNVQIIGATYTVTVAAGGTGYSQGQTIRILGTSLGGTSPANDVTLTISTISIITPGAIEAVTATGTANSSTIAYSLNGITWASATLPSSQNWSDVTYGNGLFVAVANESAKNAYSRDGITWYQAKIDIGPAAKLSYGQGVFVALDATSGTAWTTEDGHQWKEVSVGNYGYSAVEFGFNSAGDGRFVTGSGQAIGSVISAGCTTKGRANVASGRISSISLWEPGSGYTLAPTLTFFDPNATLTATTLSRISNGTLSNPSFVNRGQDYNTNSTVVLITGGGYADIFQTGLSITVKNLTSLPGPGDNLVIAGNTTIYKVTSATAIFGSVAPEIQANITLSPEMSTALSPSHETGIIIRQKYSQARLTGHDFLSIGYGNFIQTNYPDVPEDTVLSPQDQAVEVNFGRVFYTSTDQDGNFKVGGLFAVEQATGIVTLSASQFGLSGLETLSLGGIAVGTASVIIRSFSTDQSFVANSNEIIPTQRSIKAYLSNRLSQGGSNTFTGQLIAGTVLVGGANKISSTIPEGQEGAVVNMPNVIRVQGQFGGWDGDGAAYLQFVKSGRIAGSRSSI
jgi:hypothetical protein